MRLTKLQREFIDEGLHEGDYVAFPDTGTKDGINKAHEAIAEGLRLAQLAHTNLPNEYNNGRMDVYQACLNVLSFYRGDGPLQKDTLSQAVESEQAPPVADTGELVDLCESCKSDECVIIDELNGRHGIILTVTKCRLHEAARLRALPAPQPVARQDGPVKCDGCGGTRMVQPYNFCEECGRL